MRYAIILTIFVFILCGCKKDKYLTAPQLKYKSVNTTVLRSGEIITFTLSFTDLEGDLSDSLYVEQREPRCVNSGIARMYKLPGFPTAKNQEGELQVTFGYNVNGTVPIKTPQCNRNDTTVFRFVLKDKAQHVSDTALSEPIVIIR